MSNYVFGSYILEVLTAGMYPDSRIIFREYVQNACDAIDKAVEIGLLSSKDAGEICIDIDMTARSITIQDNGTGISAGDFVRIMGSIADSEKRQGENKGFRGIGKLSGLAYCSRAVFTSKSRGEGIVSRMECDASTMRKMLGSSSRNAYKAVEILQMINDFSTQETDDLDGHYFRVELLGINEENTDLLDFYRVREYLSFVAPLPYDSAFMPYSARIHDHAGTLGFNLDEYNIFLNGEQLFKRYTRSFLNTRGKGSDEIFDISFEDFKDENDELIAWMWFGLSHFKGSIDAKCPMRGLRLRKENIQIGDQDTLQPFFTERRLLHCLIGEVFCVSKDFIPNSRRDYFNENPARVEFETQLSIRLNDISRLCHDGYDVFSAFRRIDAAEKKRELFSEKLRAGGYDSYQDKQSSREAMLKAQRDAARALEKISKIRANGSCLVVKIIKHIETDRRAMQHPRAERTLFIDEHFGVQLTLREQRLLSMVFDVLKDELLPAEADRVMHTIQDKLQ